MGVIHLLSVNFLVLVPFPLGAGILTEPSIGSLPASYVLLQRRVPCWDDPSPRKEETTIQASDVQGLLPLHSNALTWYP